MGVLCISFVAFYVIVPLVLILINFKRKMTKQLNLGISFGTKTKISKLTNLNAL